MMRVNNGIDLEIIRVGQKSFSDGGGEGGYGSALGEGKDV
jgi:hypothetical protein